MASSSIKTVVYGFGLIIWTVFSLIVGQLIAGIILVSLPVVINQNVETTIGAALGYLIGLVIAILLLPAIKRRKPKLAVLGASRLPSWSDIGLGILSVVPYFLLTALLIWIGVSLLKVIDPTVGQQIAFTQVSTRIDYVVTFITLVVLAPAAEELLFRGYLLGRLSGKWHKWVAVIVTALVFGMLHAPGFTQTGVVWQWGAVADTFALGIIAGSLRMLTGSIWAGVILHAIKNMIAFYFLFVSPML